jgi:hypothetical protein
MEMSRVSLFGPPKHRRPAGAQTGGLQTAGMLRRNFCEKICENN